MLSEKKIIKISVCAGIVIAFVAFYIIWLCSTEVVYESESPDSRLRLVVTQSTTLSILSDTRYYYYVEFKPARKFRLAETGSALKCASGTDCTVKLSYDWADKHYIGYLQGMDDVADRMPSSVIWKDGEIILLSIDGTVCVLEIED